MYAVIQQDVTLSFIYAVLVAVLGASVGSFLKLCADRWPVGRSVLRPRSQCDTCKSTLAAVDLVPVLSYLLSRGRCRYCGAPIDAGTLVVEIVTGALFVLVWRYASTLQESAIYATHASLFVLVASIDFKHRLILNRITYPWALFALGAQVLGCGTGFWSGIVGGAAGLAVFTVIYVLSSGGMGLGDVKLAGVIGFTLGFPFVLQGLALAAVSGGVVGSALLLLRRKGRKDPLPFGVFLAFGGLVTMLWGRQIFEAYLGLGKMLAMIS